MRHQTKRRPARRPNYASASTPATLRKQAFVQELLAFAGEGLTVSEIGRALGVSRQLALYHVKKMAAAGQLVMLLTPCVGNGGLQYQVWNELALTRHYAARLRQSDVRELGGLGREEAHGAAA